MTGGGARTLRLSVGVPEYALLRLLADIGTMLVTGRLDAIHEPLALIEPFEDQTFKDLSTLLELPMLDADTNTQVQAIWDRHHAIMNTGAEQQSFNPPPPPIVS